MTELVAECVDLNEVKKKYPKLASYMTRNISIMLSISSIHLLLIKTVEAEQKRRNLWERIRASFALFPAEILDAERPYLSAGQNWRKADSRRVSFRKKDISVPIGR